MLYFWNKTQVTNSSPLKHHIHKVFPPTRRVVRNLSPYLYCGGSPNGEKKSFVTRTETRICKLASQQTPNVSRHLLPYMLQNFEQNSSETNTHRETFYPVDRFQVCFFCANKEQRKFSQLWKQLRKKYLFFFPRRIFLCCQEARKIAILYSHWGSPKIMRWITRVLISIKAAHPNYTGLSSFICNQNLSHSHHKQWEQ